ncbi:HEPN domain-containing protein [Clostridium sp. C2-6-12]|uniref:ApeA N-terminal domain 1-containing protein n=1 Tax=Clostridium sp. C2-6-12 TaxID=2698832 RepID=UPI001368376D|nr:HEPN domain-containing protein [Clostridium sp. C2-6-12]
MENTKEYIGFWYLPDNRENKIYGTLNIDEDNKLKLNLCGVFGELKEQFNYEKLKVINGFTKEGEKITLLNSNIADFKFKMPGIPSKNYMPQYMIIGEHFNSIDEIKINSVSSRYTDLSKWISIAPFERDVQDEEKEFVLRYKLPEQRTYKLNDKTVKISFNATMDGDLLKECTIYQNTLINFGELKEKTLDLTLDLINDFSEFLTLCIGEKISSYDIQAITEKGNKIKIIWNGMLLKEDSEKTLYSILVPYPFIQDKFQECLENWYKKNRQLKPIINYVVEAYEKVFYIPMSFMKIIQAFEAFSRRMRNNCKVDSKEHQNRIDYIINRIDNEDYKKWLEDKLRYSNEPNLNSRIKDLFTELDFILNMTAKEKKSIANKITLTRNYFTHFDENNKDNAMSTNQIFFITNYLLLGLRVLIMMELGLEREFIKAQIDNVGELWFLNNLKKEFKLNINEN